MRTSPSCLSPRKGSSWPVPVSVTVYNLMAPPQETEAENFGMTKMWFRPEHKSQLLVPVCLNVVVSTKPPPNDTNVLYSCSLEHDTVHPCWDLLDERIDLLTAILHKQNVDEKQDENEELAMYESMRAQITLFPKQEASKHYVLADMPLHPKRLRKLPPQDVHTTTGGPPLKALPPNAIIIRYSDGSTRVPSLLYDFLLRQQIVSEDDKEDLIVMPNNNLSDSSLGSPQGQEEERLPRFDDDVFDALDKAVSTPQRASPSALLMMEKRHDASSPHGLLQQPIDTTQLAMPDLKQTRKSLLDQEDNVRLPSELEATVDSLKQQVLELEQFLFEEQDSLKHDLELLQEAKDEITTIREETQRFENDTHDIVAETENELKRQAQLEFCLEAQRIKLFQELKTIYPISCVNDKLQRYCIRGLELPIQELLSVAGTSSTSEDEISAALGFTCHVVAVMAKYLDIPLRYRLVCNSSRSAVQDDGTAIFPLFQARMVEKSELDRGITLLERNVDCVLMARDVATPRLTTHLLAKIKALYEHVMDGTP